MKVIGARLVCSGGAVGFFLLLVCSSSCASREDRASTPSGRRIDDRIRSWVNVEPKWSGCESFGIDAFPPFPKKFRLVETRVLQNPSGAVEAATGSWSVVDCDGQGLCTSRSSFGSAFALDSKRSNEPQLSLLGSPIVKWTEDGGTSKCRYVVTRPILNASNSRAPLRLFLELEVFEVAGPCRPAEVNLDKLPAVCAAVRTAETD